MIPQSFLILVCGLTVCGAVLLKRDNTSSAWSVVQFSSLVTFGDSYTDENRLSYFIQHAGAAPPPGTFLPEVFKSDLSLEDNSGLTRYSHSALRAGEELGHDMSSNIPEPK